MLDIRNNSLIIQHRANTLQSLGNAISSISMGTSGVEFDVVLTMDNVAVIFHDKTIDGRNISDIELTELQQIDPNIPTLKQYFDNINGIGFNDKFEFHLEIKSPDLALWNEVYTLLCQNEYRKIKQNTIILSFQAHIIEKALSNNMRACLSLRPNYDIEKDTCFFDKMTTVSDTKQLTIDAIKNTLSGQMPDFICMHHNLLNEEFISALKDNNISISTYTVNELLQLGDFKVNRIISDYPVKIFNNLNSSQTIEDNSVKEVTVA